MILASPKRNEVHKDLLGIAPSVTQSSSTASVMLRRAVASKARNAFRDGTTDVIVVAIAEHRT